MDGEDEEGVAEEALSGAEAEEADAEVVIGADAAAAMLACFACW
jgi:hypothetical protein